MREIFFNSFKEKILRGDVESHIIASGIPMSDAFLDTYDTDDISIEQYRNLEDFDRFSNGNKTTKFEETKFKYETYGVDYQNYYEDDLSEKPIFVNADNAEKFLQVYGNEILYSDPYVKSKIDGYLASDDININSGFYYVTKKSHLNWIAKRVNDDYNFNNRIVVVLGDDIGTSNEEDGIAYESVIGSNPNKPFQGIFDLNGHAVNNLNLKCKTNSNGIIGYLGDRGIVRDGIVINPVFTGMNKISLEKIKNDCSDVVCGTLVGTNYGTVENIVTSGTMKIMDGFCPEVYLAGNKTEYQAGMNTYEENNYTNAFFPSKFCINSIYNVIPYVGYFCEGADSYFNDAVNPYVKEAVGDTLERWKYLTRINVDMRLGMDYTGSDTIKNYNNVSAYNLDHYIEGKLSNTSNCDLNDVALAKVIPYADPPTSASNKVGSYVYDQMSSKADTVWFGYWNKNTTGNTYLADIYRPHDANTGIFSTTMYIPPLITMSTDQIIPDKLMKNTVKSIGKYVDLYGDEQFDLTKNPSFMHQYPDYAANLAHQIRDQIVMYYENSNTYTSHVSTHQKMNPYSRIAYYLSPIVGNNFGTIRNIDCRHTIRESDYTFVGFIGNVCGKENCGDISNCYVDLDIEGARTDEKLAVRNYTNTNNYLPNYEELNSAYSNQINIFGYNYDYCQSPYGTPEAEYSAHSADCIKVTPRFYSFRDLYATNFPPYGINRHKISDFIFNTESYSWVDINKNWRRDEVCNFNVLGAETSNVAREIPDRIRKQKMKFRFEKVNSEQADTTGPNDYSIVVRIANFYRMVKKASYKFYNPYYKNEKDNWENPFWENQIDALYSAFDAGIHLVQHMDLNYLGDAAKTVSRNDVWKDAPSFTNSKGEEYKITIADLLDYCPDFNGSIGRTEDRAKEFCRNMMDAKVALGWDMLGNQTFSVSYKYPDYDHPFVDDQGFFGTTNNKSDGHFKIPANTGPNDTDRDWELNSNIVDMAWYMPPAPNVYPDNNGPKAFNPEISVLEDTETVNANANNPSNFCSIHPYGLWDLFGKPEEDDYKLFNADGISKPSIGRSMLTIEPRYGMVNLATNVAKVIIQGDQSARDILNRNRLLNTDLECWVNKIYIPMANRTQKSAWQSSTFCEEAGCSGIYITDYGRDPLYDVNLKPSKTVKEEDIGNLDVAYVDMSIGVRVEEMDNSDGRYRYETYPVIVQIPIEKIFVPISAVRAWSLGTKTIDKIENDRMTEMVDEYTDIKQRKVNFYPLTPAYDLLDPNLAQIRYKLKSIYNIGGIAGMINHSEKYIEHGFYNFDGKIPHDHEKSNNATCGSIKDCNIYITPRTNQFVSDLQCSWTENPDNTGGLIECNNRTIGVANKIGGVAAIYEYRQNDLGTSPHSKKKETCTDGLQRFRFQKFRFERINVGGQESIRGYEVYQEGSQAYNNQRRYLKLRSDNRIFSPFIDWANISNMLDTTNFFGYRELYGLAPDVTYMPYHSSNFPVDGNPMLWTAWMEGKNDTIGQGVLTPKPVVSQTDEAMLASAYPIANEPIDGYTDDSTSIYTNTSLAYMEYMNRYGSTSAEHDNKPYLSCQYPRIGMNKHYDWILNSLLRCRDVYLYGSSNQYPYIGISMSPMANSPCSDYNDVYLQMFNGNPNFVNRKLSKSTMEAKCWVVYRDSNFRSKVHNAEYRSYNKIGPCLSILNVYNKRSGQPRDKYFTWDYETESRSLDPLQFDILYKKPKGHSRGLWIHQLGEYDSYDVLQYAMKGGKYGINDGACLHLGYLPSDKEVVDLLNADMLNPDALPRGDRFEEGHAISGYGFNGMLLVDPDTKDLICYLDTENARDFDLGCWVAPLSEKIKVENSAYGLLTEIVAENSPRIEQDVNDDTKVTIVENVVYVDNKPIDTSKT